MSGVGHLELLLWATGTSATEQQTLSIQVSLQHPLSQGRVYINSSDPFDDPIIDPQYLSHWADLVSMREGVKLLRKIGGALPMKNVLTGEVSPGSNITTDQDIEAFLLKNVGSQYHPANTLAMLPRDGGGVVDAKLRVYGLGNVRVVDASIFPFSLAAHVRLLSLSVFSHFPTRFFSFRPQYMRLLNKRPISFAMTGDLDLLDQALTARTPPVAPRATTLLMHTFPNLLSCLFFSRSFWLQSSPRDPRFSCPHS